MTISSEDVKLFESQRLNDEEDGGGRATGTEVIDGNVNNLFQDISRIDRTIGDVALRKAYVGIYTAKRIVATAEADRAVTQKFVSIGGNDSRAFLQTGALPGTVRNTLTGTACFIKASAAKPTQEYKSAPSTTAAAWQRWRLIRQEHCRLPPSSQRLPYHRGSRLIRYRSGHRERLYGQGACHWMRI